MQRRPIADFTIERGATEEFVANTLPFQEREGSQVAHSASATAEIRDPASPTAETEIDHRPDSPGGTRAGKPPAALDLPEVPGYEVLALLGRGGMGAVYQARHRELKRLVALKVILAGPHAGPTELARFHAEAEAVARLQHPNIVQIFEVGTHVGQPFFSLEFVAGGTLADKLKGTPLSPREAAELVETLARAVHAAHERGVIHRDLKPANILLSADGAPKIADFGLAKRAERDSGQTRTGEIMGTPSYMAPEQAAGDTKSVGPAADIYALGAILYELLTGRPPFRAATAVETVLQVRSQEPLPPQPLVAPAAARRGDHLPQVFAQGARQALWHGTKSGRRPAPLPERSADRGPSDQPRRARRPLVPSQPHGRGLGGDGGRGAGGRCGDDGLCLFARLKRTRARSG